MSPIHTGWAEMPTSTKTMAIRSRSDRGLSAERIPIGSAISIQKTAPPKTSEAVTGAAFRTTELTVWRFVNERPRLGVLKCGEPWTMPATGIRRPKNFPYCT